MVTEKEIENRMRDFNYSAYDLAAALIECEEEKNARIEELESEIADHECTI